MTILAPGAYGFSAVCGPSWWGVLRGDGVCGLCGRPRVLKRGARVLVSRRAHAAVQALDPWGAPGRLAPPRLPPAGVVGSRPKVALDALRSSLHRLISRYFCKPPASLCNMQVEQGATRVRQHAHKEIAVRAMRFGGGLAS